MDALRQPPPLVCSGNLEVNWTRFRQRLDIFMLATGFSTKKPAEEVALLLHVAGEEALEVYNTFKFSDGESRDDYDVVVKKFEEYCVPKKNEIYERYVFRTRQQAEGEPFEQFLRDLKIKVQSCGFSSMAESMLRDQVVYGIRDKKLRTKLLKETDLTLETAVRLCQATEAADRQNMVWNDQEKCVDVVRPEKCVDAVRPEKHRVRRSRCTRCNTLHDDRACPAFGKTCFRCGKSNHFVARCPAKPKSRQSCCITATDQARGKTASSCQENTASDESSGEFDILDVGVCTIASRPEWLVTVGVGATGKLSLKVDTGSQANLLPYSLYRKLSKNASVRPSPATLRSYTGGIIKHIGLVTLQLKMNGTTAPVDFFVVKNGHQALLGLETSEKLGLVSRVDSVKEEDIVSQFPDVFSGTGCLGRPYHLTLREGAQPIVQPARRVPQALRTPLKSELDRMEKEGIIRKVPGPSEWVSPLVLIRKKDGSLRVCMDPRELNQNLKREHYQLPRREDIESDLAGATVFTTLDAKAGFHQVPLDPSSSEICTFGTPFGRYCFLRLPFGIASAPEVFQRVLSEIFEGIEGVRVYIDDILIWGRDQAEHDERLLRVLEAARKAGLTFNRNKCKFAQSSVCFLGDVISAEGITPNPSLVCGLTHMPTPGDKKALRRLLGMINYFRKYVPNLAQKTKNLRSLTREDSEFEWLPPHEEELAELKDILSQPPVLAVFDPLKATKISTDASPTGLGAVLLQLHGEIWRPVAYASRALSDPETRYAQIEKEALGLVFGCERFHHFVYAADFTLETDHQPLIAISKKGLNDMPPRLQRFFVRLLKYTFTLQYVPGSQLVLADTLSRQKTHIPREPNDLAVDIEVHATHVLFDLVAPTTLDKLVTETQHDPILQQVISALSNNSPVDGLYRPFYAELTVVNGVLFKGSRVVVPSSMRADMLKRLHEGHLGISKCKARARQLMFWPGMNADIVAFANRCSACKALAYKLPQEPFRIREVPKHPWSRVGVDLLEYAHQTYLVVYDAQSNFLELEKLQNATAAEVVDKLKAIFSRHGIPVEVNSDNGPQFTSREFSQFVAKYEFRHVTSSPRYPQSNGLAEKGVQVAKRILRKCALTGDDHWLGLLNYRTMPLEDGRSPSELLMGRRLRTRLPDFGKARGTQVKKHKQIMQGCRLSQLQPGDVVRLQSDVGWNPKARVLEECSPRSYRLVTDTGRCFRRNRRHLLRTEESLDDTLSDTDSSIPPQQEILKLLEPSQPVPNPEDVDHLAQSLLGVTTPTQQSQPVPRRSTRPRKPRVKLDYDERFNQIP